MILKLVLIPCVVFLATAANAYKFRRSEVQLQVNNEVEKWKSELKEEYTTRRSQVDNQYEPFKKWMYDYNWKSTERTVNQYQNHIKNLSNIIESEPEETRANVCKSAIEGLNTAGNLILTDLTKCFTDCTEYHKAPLYQMEASKEQALQIQIHDCIERDETLDAEIEGIKCLIRDEVKALVAISQAKVHININLKDAEFILTDREEAIDPCITPIYSSFQNTLQNSIRACPDQK